ncbi:MAG: DUF1622 domain-containing protein [Ruegeria sp.]
MIELVQTTIILLELAAATLLVLGFVISTVIWMRDSISDDGRVALKKYRRALSRTILIGLEVLVASTVAKTVVVEPTLEGMGTIVAMVVIRTLLGWTTSLESTGRWPWQQDVDAK